MIKSLGEVSEEPITVAQAKLWLHVDHNDDDALIEFLITAAREVVEDRTGLLVARREVEVVLPVTPCGLLNIPGPVIEIESLSQVDPDSTQTEISSTLWVLSNPHSSPGSIGPVNSWPITFGRASAVRVLYVAGYETPAAVPSRVKLVMHLLVRGWYDNRSSIVVGKSPAAIPFGVDDALQGLRVLS